MKGRFINDLVEIAMDAFGPGMTVGEVLEHVYPTDKLYIAQVGGKSVGFATLKLEEDSGDLAGTAIRPGFQGNGLYSEFCRRRVTDARTAGKNSITLRTQNPKVELGVKRTLEKMYKTEVVPQRGIRPMLYGRKLTEERPFSGVEAIDKDFSRLDYERGDGFALEFKLPVYNPRRDCFGAF
jgi:hypothetical protein